MSIQLTRLANGLTVLTDTVKTVDSVAVGVWCGVGTRHEDAEENGIAHMVEHMLFKGTKTRTAQQIAEQVEAVGGRMNAYTGREATAYYIHLLSENLPLALTILADMVCHSTFPEDEIERERGVITQEIGMTEDDPSDLVFDMLQETVFKNQMLGAPILGTREIIARLQKADMQRYVERRYAADNMVVAAAGNVEHDLFVRLVENLFSSLPGRGMQPMQSAVYSGGQALKTTDNAQVNLVLGFQGVSRFDPDYHANRALSALLGSGMSSRLFTEVREKRGLVYSIFTHQQSYADSGLFTVYAGTGAAEVAELVPVVCDELKRSAQDVSEEELAKVRTLIRSGILMGRESMQSRVESLARYWLSYGEVLDVDLSIARISALRTDDIMRVSERIFSSDVGVAAIGPLTHLEDVEKIQARLRA